MQMRGHVSRGLVFALTVLCAHASCAGCSLGTFCTAISGSTQNCQACAMGKYSSRTDQAASMEDCTACVRAHVPAEGVKRAHARRRITACLPRAHACAPSRSRDPCCMPACWPVQYFIGVDELRCMRELSRWPVQRRGSQRVRPLRARQVQHPGRTEQLDGVHCMPEEYGERRSQPADVLFQLRTLRVRASVERAERVVVARPLTVVVAR